MSKHYYIAPCHFGMEAVLKREIQDLGYEIGEVEDGKVTFLGEEDAIARGNMFLRTTERILLRVGQFRAETFEELFQGVKAIPWEKYIPEDGKFWVAKATSIKSKLFSPSDIQSIIKKAMVERLKKVYGTEWFAETGASYPVRVTFLKDQVTLGIDTSGESLHKRGYRKSTVKAPVTETLAAAILLLSPWNKDRILVDPFCGSGTFCIEAAMIGADMAPGRNRTFLAEQWENMMPADAFSKAREEAKAREEKRQAEGIQLQIQGYDKDPDSVAKARENAVLAQVDSWIHFQQREVKDLHHPKKYGFIVTNPPYGERLEEKAAMPALYAEMGTAFRGLDSWSWYILSGYEEAEKWLGRKADKNRKIYNGMMKTYLYQYMGPKPPKRKYDPSNGPDQT